jgi:hypothetical protein
MSLSYSQMMPPTSSNNVTVKADPLVMSLIFVVGVGLILFGMSEKNRAEKEDALRSVKNFPAVITAISKYDVTYIPMNYNVKRKYVYNIKAELVEPEGKDSVFNLSSGTGTQSSQIKKVIKKPTEIVVEIVQNGVSSTATISEMNFTRKIEESDVGKSIDIEFDPNDMKNISMAVDGLTIGQLAIIYGTIFAGILALILDIFLLYRYMNPQKK